MEVAIKINGTKEISLNPETPLEQEYLPPRIVTGKSILLQEIRTVIK